MKTITKIIFSLTLISIISLNACKDKYEPAECNYNLNIPDTALKNAFLKTWISYGNDREGYLDENGDGEICDGEAMRLEEFNLPNESVVKSFEGIQYFPNLKDLNLNDCNFDSISMISSTIIKLGCNSASLAKLDVSKLENLTELGCAYNNLTELDVSKNIKLITLGCSGNLLSSLDVTNNVNLEKLYFWENNISMIDVKGLEKLKYLDFHGNQISTIDLSENISLSVVNFQGNPISEIDLSNNADLVGIYFGDNPMTMLDISKNNKVIHLDNEGEFPFEKICVWTLPFPPSELTLKNFPVSFDGFEICE
jgi:Leucine-rich repeat (LRR) protein